MRNPERIGIFLRLVDWDKLEDRWTITVDNEKYKPSNEPLKQVYEDNKEAIVDYWEMFPDQRIGQVLINLGLILDGFFIWNDEEYLILEDQGIEPREYYLWGSVFNKDGSVREETKWTVIKDLETEHLHNILKAYYNKTVSITDHMLKVLQDEKERRSSISGEVS